jgi:hypothetical protein
MAHLAQRGQVQFDAQPCERAAELSQVRRYERRVDPRDGNGARDAPLDNARHRTLVRTTRAGVFECAREEDQRAVHCRAPAALRRLFQGQNFGKQLVVLEHAQELEQNLTATQREPS